MDLKFKILIGIVVIIIISGIISSFSGGGGDGDGTDTNGGGGTDDGEDDGTDDANGGGSSTESGSSQTRDNYNREYNEDRVTAMAKFSSKVADPLNDAKILEISTKLQMNKFDIDGDGKVSANDIPDGDLKTELMGYDVDGDDILTEDEFREYVKHRGRVSRPEMHQK